MLVRWLVLLGSVLVCAVAFAAEGLVTVQSPYSTKETVDRLEAIVKARDFTVFARIDHAAGAQRVGQALRPTELLIFGNPRGGTPFMVCQQSVGIDLPLKALVWEDAAGQVWLGYNDPAYLATRHQVTACGHVVQTMQALLAAMAKEATAK
jgi:uncharacterized protein (DUF302 family)